MFPNDIPIIRSARRTLSIEVDDAGNATIRAPLHAGDQAIASFVREKSRWLQRATKKQQETYARRPQRLFKDGELFLYLGNSFPLLFKEGLGVVTHARILEVTDAFYLCSSAKHKAKSVLTRWYKNRARFVFRERAEMFATRMGVDVSVIKLSSAGTRWGSCGAKNTLNFNWRLVMAPMDVIDSVVVHELAHCKHKNHGKRFWEYVAQHCPDYDTHDQWLKQNAPLLHWQE